MIVIHYLYVNRLNNLIIVIGGEGEEESINK